jgi:hypothetical protein
VRCLELKTKASISLNGGSDEKCNYDNPLYWIHFACLLLLKLHRMQKEITDNWAQNWTSRHNGCD